jgi:hypothetical protein
MFAIGARVMPLDHAVMIFISKEESKRQNMETRTKKGEQNGTNKTKFII